MGVGVYQETRPSDTLAPAFITKASSFLRPTGYEMPEGILAAVDRRMPPPNHALTRYRGSRVGEVGTECLVQRLFVPLPVAPVIIQSHERRQPVGKAHSSASRGSHRKTLTLASLRGAVRVRS